MKFTDPGSGDGLYSVRPKTGESP